MEKHSEPTPEDRGKEAEVAKVERSETTTTDQRPHTNTTFVVEIESPTSVSTATSDAATVEQTGQPGCTPMIKLDRRRPYYMYLLIFDYITQLHPSHQREASVDPLRACDVSDDETRRVSSHSTSKGFLPESAAAGGGTKPAC